jgi:hypothetical protein
MLQKKERQLEISLSWFDKWRFDCSCSESAWNQWSEKLTSPLKKGVALGTGVVIGVGAAIYTSAQVVNHFNLMPQPTPIEAPIPKK